MVKGWFGWVRRSGRLLGKRVGVFIILAALIAGISSGIASQNAQAQGLGGLTQGMGGGISTCAIETVGWVICPVMRSIAKIADYGFAFINSNYLRIPYSLASGDSGIKTGWDIILNLANIAFAMAFIWIIYSQVTGRNAGSYNIKRLIPKLIVGAILVNSSFWICTSMVQLSNVFGSAILDILTGVAERIGTPAMTLESAANGFKDGILIDMTSAVLTKTGTVWILLAPVAAVTISIAVVSGAGLVLLIARQVVVAMLILVSPLLFVAYLLPNLERVFQQSVRLFLQLLLVFPVIAFLLGVGQIVSATIISVGGGDSTDFSVKDDSYQSKSGGSGHIGTDLAAAGAAVLPLVGVWFMMKGISSVMSTAGTKISANVGSGKRSGKEEAKVTSKVGKVEPKPNTMLGKSFNRRPAFSRNAAKRRKASAGGSTLAAMMEARKPVTPPAEPKPPTPPEPRTPDLPLNDALKNQLEQPDQNPNGDNNAQDAGRQIAAALANQQPGEIKAGEASLGNAGDLSKQLGNAMKEGMKGASVGAAAGKAAAGTKGASKDSQRSFGSAPQAAAPSAPQAPSGGSAPVATQIITIAAPAAARGSSGALNGTADGTVQGLQHPPEAGVAKMARARAQKYIFDSASAIEEAQEKIDLLAKQSNANKAAQAATPSAPPTQAADPAPSTPSEQ